MFIGAIRINEKLFTLLQSALLYCFCEIKIRNLPFQLHLQVE